MNYTELKEDQERLTKGLGREIEIRQIQCECNGDWRRCQKCAGDGCYHDLFFVSCGHVVGDADLLECQENDCIEMERLAEVMRRTDHLDPFAGIAQPIKSCAEIQSELDAIAEDREMEVTV